MKEEIMKRILWIAAALGAALIAAAVLGAEPAPEKTADEAAQKWLGIVDSGKYAESWAAACELFKKSITAEQWETAVRAARGPLGKLLSRRLDKAQFTRSLPGAPEGEYVVLRYDASFENHKTAVETVTTTKEKDGSWRVAGYFVK